MEGLGHAPPCAWCGAVQNGTATDYEPLPFMELSMHLVHLTSTKWRRSMRKIILVIALFLVIGLSACNEAYNGKRTETPGHTPDMPANIPETPAHFLAPDGYHPLLQEHTLFPRYMHNWDVANPDAKETALLFVLGGQNCDCRSVEVNALTEDLGHQRVYVKLAGLRDDSIADIEYIIDLTLTENYWHVEEAWHRLTCHRRMIEGRCS